MSAARAIGKLGALSRLFEEDVNTSIGKARPVFGIQNTPGGVRLVDCGMGGRGKILAQQSLFASHPIDSDDSKCDVYSDCVMDKVYSEDRNSD